MGVNMMSPGNSFLKRRQAFAKRGSRKTTVLQLEGSKSKSEVRVYKFAPAFPALPEREAPLKGKVKMAAGVTKDLPRGPSTYYVAPEDLIVVGVDTKVKAGEHPLLRTKGEVERLHAPLDEAMVGSMMVAGVRRTVFVRRVGHTLEVVEGRRRVLHARETNKRLLKAKKDPIKIKVELKQGTDDQVYAQSRLDNRHYLAETPLMTAEAAAIMLDKMSEQEVADFLGVQIPMLRVYLALNRAIPELRNAVERGEASVTAVSKLVNLPIEEQADAYKKLLAEGGGKITVAQTAAVRAKANAKKNGNGAHSGNPPPSKRVLNRLLEKEDARKEVDVPKGFWEGVEFALGRKNPVKISGMLEAMRTVSSPKRKTA